MSIIYPQNAFYLAKKAMEHKQREEPTLHRILAPGASDPHPPDLILISFCSSIHQTNII